MTPERYDFDRAQSEAEMIKQKIDSGLTTDYDEADKFVDKDILDAKIGIIGSLREGSTQLAGENIPEIKTRIVELLCEGSIAQAQKIRRELKVSDKDCHDAAQEAMAESLANGDIILAIRVKKHFIIEFEKVIQSEEVQNAAKKAMVTSLANGDVVWAERIRQEFDMSEETIDSIVQEHMVESLARGDLDLAKRISRKFDMSEETIDSIAQEAMVASLARGDVDLAYSIKKTFYLFYLSKEVQNAAKEVIVASLAKGDIDLTKRIRKEFAVSGHDFAKEVIVASLAKGDIDLAKRIRKEFYMMSEETIDSIAQEAMAKSLARGDVDLAKRIRQEYAVSVKTVQSKEVQDAAKDAIVASLVKGDVDLAKRIRQEYAVSVETVQSKEVQDAAKEGMVVTLSDGRIDDAAEIEIGFEVPEETAQAAAKEGIVATLSDGRFGNAAVIEQEYDIPEEVIWSEEVQNAAKEGMVKSLAKGDVDFAIKIRRKFVRSEDTVQSAEVQAIAKEAMVTFLARGEVHLALITKQNFALPEEFVQSIVRSEGVQYSIRVAKFFLSVDPESLEVGNASLDNLSEDEIKDMFDFARRNFEAWQDEDEEIVSGPFERGATIFGYKNMLKYIHRHDISAHDALHAFDYVISNLYQSSGLSVSKFYGNVLQQVVADTSEYSEGISYHRLNTISQNTDAKQIGTTLDEIASFSLIPRLQELSEHIHDTKDVFTSWSNLKKFYEIKLLLNRREILEKLVKLRSEGKEHLYYYVETLAFHGTSDVSIKKVMEFWQEPERFLAIGDSHSGQQHQMKKPSNYIDIPNLDLTAVELRDALVEGALDGLQSFHPLEITYEVAKESSQTEDKPINELLKKALGSRKEGIPGLAQSPGKLFAEVSRYFKASGLNLQDFLGGEVELSVEQSAIVQSMLNHPEFGLPSSGQQDTDQYRGKIYLKSDPEGVVAGNDTACCMPFGSGKNNVYTFNPVCSVFTVQKKTSDGKWRTVAQSVLTEDRDVKKNIKELIDAVQDAETPQLGELIPEDILRDSKSVVIADNVEVAPNYRKRPESGQILEEIYRDFFTEYLMRHDSDGNFDHERVIIGMGYSDAMNHLPRVENTYLPQAPVAYSDNAHKTSYSLSLSPEDTKPSLIMTRNVVAQEQPPNLTEELSPAEITGISGLGYLSFRDTLPVAFLEGKAYADNPELLVYMHNLENGLIAKDINNSAKGRPNMSLKWSDQQGRIHGYILAYEGKMKTGEGDSDSVINISDLASDRESRFAGGNLIRGFIELYRKNYIENGKLVPIYFEGREQTSYAIAIRQIERVSKSLGVKLEIKEGESYQQGNDTMHPVWIVPVAA